MCSMAIVIAGYGQSGRVFVDNNGNGTYDKSDKTVSGVSVTDGVNVTTTNKSGQYSLSGHKNAKFAYITTPSGYNSVGEFYQRIEPSKGEYNFILKPNSVVGKDGSHSFVQITDTEIGSVENQDVWVSSLKARSASQNAAFIIHTGDICYEGGLKSHKKLVNDDNMGRMVRYCIGNHDYVKGTYGEELFETNFGPIYYSFEHGNIHYIVTPMPHGDHKPGFDPNDLLTWLKNDLKTKDASKKVIVFNHDLFNNGDKFVFGKGDGSVDLADFGLIGWVYGHWHINHVKKFGDVVTITTSSADKAGIDHSVAAFRDIRISGKGEISSQLVYPYLDKVLTVSQASLDGQKLSLSVNGYNTNSVIKSITAEVSAGGKSLSKVSLNAKTDWNWGATIDLKKPRQSVDLKLTATYADGKQSELSKEVVSKGTSAVKLAENWCNLLGNANHNGVVEGNVKTPLQLAWSANVGSNIYMSSPIIYDGNVVVATVDESLGGKCVVVALDAISGAERWRYRTRNSVKNTIVAGDGKIFAQDAEGYLYAIDANNGDLVWEYKLNVNPIPAIIEGLVIRDNVIYAGTGAGLTALKTNGDVIWTNSEWNQREGTTSTLSLGNDVVLSGSQWQALFANDTKTGKKLWDVRKDGIRDRGATPLIIDNLVYLISSQSLFVMDLKSGRIIVRKELPYRVDATSTPLLVGDLIVFGTTDSGIVAINSETFETKWIVRTLPSLIYTAPYTRTPVATVESSPIAVGETIFIGASDGIFRAINKEGVVVWQYKLGAPMLTTVAVSGNAIFVADYSGNVSCFTPKI